MHRFTRFSLSLVFLMTLMVTVPGIALGYNYLNTDGAVLAPLLTTSNDPDDHLVTLPSFYDGVGIVTATKASGGSIGGSGSLLLQGGRQYLLTAAHLLYWEGAFVTNLKVTFPNGSVFTGSQYFLPPEWNGEYIYGFDIALVKLAAPVLTTNAYSILREEITSPTTGDLAGYGDSDYSPSGSDPGTYPWKTLRQGSNTFGEVYWESINSVPINGFPYAFDFDSGSAANNSITIVSGFPSDLGLGDAEVMVARGDSGGPTFIDGKIAGVHSFIATFGITGGDIDDLINSSWGEIGGDTRVALVADWIDSVTAPLPGGMYLFASGFGLLLVWRRLSS